jgi:ADP-ribose pyrophosphatase YjhB (NUDIX family)
MYVRHAHCSFCGTRYPEEIGWPRRCITCRQTSYMNPLPVAVALIPVDGGLLTVRRSILPQIGQLALPGGFIDIGEQWRDAIARELWEETGVRVDPDAVTFFEVLNSPGGHMLIFGRCPALAELPPFVPNSEVSELVVVREPIELAFPLHTQAIQAYFGGA